MQFMKESNVGHVEVPAEIGGGFLVITPSTTKAPLKKDSWSKGFDSFCKKRKLENISFQEFETEVQDTRETVIKSVLKRKK